MARSRGATETVVDSQSQVSTARIQARRHDLDVVVQIRASFARLPSPDRART